LQETLPEIDQGYEVMTEIVYNIPISMFSGYRGKNVIVRSYDPVEMVMSLSDYDLDHLVAVQLLSMTGNVDVLTNWGNGIPIDLLMLHPQTEFPFLYRYAKLLNRHPLRVCIPVVSGFSKAVKVATSLKLFVKLEIGQPDPSLIDEIHRVLNFYIHNPTVALPIEYFHSTFLAMYHSEQSSLWDVQEENPSNIRYVTEDGRETIARRLGTDRAEGNFDNFVADWQSSMIAEKTECYDCQYFRHCGSYFKWPRKTYRCDGVKSLFGTLEEAAQEMQGEITVLTQAQKGVA
jgi:hypothetical protein